MAIDILDLNGRRDLSTALQRSFEFSADARERRKKLIDKYADTPDFMFSDSDVYDTHTLVNLFQQFVRGHLQVLAYNAPKWSVKARTVAARGIDFLIQNLLNRLNDLLHMQQLCEQWALDSAFGDCHAKIRIGIAPKGVTSAVSPRAYRIPPNHIIYDQTAAAPHEAGFIADYYLVPLNEAKASRGFFPDVRRNLTAWRETAAESMLPDGLDIDALSQDMVRLIDVYIPTLGAYFTWPCNGDRFEDVKGDPLRVTPTPINPYSTMKATQVPDTLNEFALLDTLLAQHVLANDMLLKAAEQARMSKRNPVAQDGYDEELQNLLDAPDNEAAIVEDLTKIGLYTIPGADPGIIQLGTLAMQWFSQFSQYGGNELQAVQGADTARQAQALTGQISSIQSFVRSKFERFLSEVGMKLAALAFESQSFELDIATRVPGTQIDLNVGWSPRIARQGVGINDFNFEVVPLSTGLRTPQMRVAQLEQASQAIAQWMALKAQGAPLNMAAIMATYADAFDQVPQIEEWWSGEETDPTPEDRATQAYTTMARTGGPSERNINYQGTQRPQEVMAAPQQGGMQLMGGAG